MICRSCGSTGPFLQTVDRVLHVVRGHVGPVWASDHLLGGVMSLTTQHDKTTEAGDEFMSKAGQLAWERQTAAEPGAKVGT